MAPRFMALLLLGLLTLTACVPDYPNNREPSASLPTPTVAPPSSIVAQPSPTPDPRMKALRAALDLTRASQAYMLTFTSLLTGTSALDRTSADRRAATNILLMSGEFNRSNWYTTFIVTNPDGGNQMLSNELVTTGDISYARHTPLANGVIDTWYTLPRQEPLAIQTAPGALDLLLGAQANLAEFQPAGEQRLDDQQCALYRSYGDAALSVFDLFAYMPSLVTPDRAGAQSMQHELVIWQCADGYIHQIHANLAVRDSDGKASRPAIFANLQLSRFNTATFVAAPPTSEPLPNSHAFSDNLARGTAPVVHSALMFDVPVEGQPIDQINAGEIVQVLAKSSDMLWYQISDIRGLMGWIDSRVLNLQPSALAILPVVEPEAALLPIAWSAYQHGRLHLALPKTWQTLPLSKAELERTVGQMSTQNPEFAALVQKLIQSGQYKQVGLLAVEVGATTRHKANLTLIAVPSPTGMAPAQVLEVLGTQLLSVPALRLLESDKTLQISGLSAARFTYTLAVNMPDHSIGTLLGIQYYLTDATDTYVLTITGEYGDALTRTASRISSFIRVDMAPDASTPSSGLAQTVANGGNLRSNPRIATDTVIGQVCPDDQVVVLSSQQVSGAIWKRIRVTSTAQSCHPERVPIGTVGWLNNSLLAP